MVVEGGVQQLPSSATSLVRQLLLLAIERDDVFFPSGGGFVLHEAMSSRSRRDAPWRSAVDAPPGGCNI